MSNEGEEAMPDYRSMFDRDYIGAWDLLGKDVTVTIARVEAGTLTSQGNKKTKKPIVWFEGREKGLALNKTNARTIADMYGNDTVKWVGKRITIWPTTTQFGRETVECIRVRPNVPGAQKRSNGGVQKDVEAADDGAPVAGCPECEGVNSAECAVCFGGTQGAATS